LTHVSLELIYTALHVTLTGELDHPGGENLIQMVLAKNGLGWIWTKMIDYTLPDPSRARPAADLDCWSHDPVRLNPPIN
jgi:hypothetical protein